MQHILIIGATGVLGLAAATHFLKKGINVSAAVRNPQKAAELEKLGASIIPLDLAELPAQVPQVFREADVVLTAAHSMMGKGKNFSGQVDDTAHRWLIDQAAGSGIKQFIYTSVHGVSPEHPVDFFRTKYNVEEYLKKSRLSYTILRMPAFMEWHAYNLLGKQLLEKGKASILGKGNNKTNFIAVKDVVGALNQIAGNAYYFNKTISLAGPDNVSRNEVAKLFADKLGITLKVSHLPEPAVKMLSAVFKPFHPGVSRIMKLAVLGEHSNQTRPREETVEQFGIRPTSMEAFVENIVNTRRKPTTDIQEQALFSR